MVVLLPLLMTLLVMIVDIDDSDEEKPHYPCWCPCSNDTLSDIDDNDEYELNSYSMFNDMNFAFDKWSSLMV